MPALGLHRHEHSCTWVHTCVPTCTYIWGGKRLQKLWKGGWEGIGTCSCRDPRSDSQSPPGGLKPTAISVPGAPTPTAGLCWHKCTPGAHTYTSTQTHKVSPLKTLRKSIIEVEHSSLGTREELQAYKLLCTVHRLLKQGYFFLQASLQLFCNLPKRSRPPERF